MIAQRWDTPSPDAALPIAVVGNGSTWLKEREGWGEKQPYLIDCSLLTLGNSLSAEEVGNN